MFHLVFLKEDDEREGGEGEKEGERKERDGEREAKRALVIIGLGLIEGEGGREREAKRALIM